MEFLISLGRFRFSGNDGTIKNMEEQSYDGNV
jgi:hypothetical protein